MRSSRSPVRAPASSAARSSASTGASSSPAHERPGCRLRAALLCRRAGYNRRTIEGLRRLSAQDLALIVPARRDSGDEPWPIWAIAGHTAGTRVYWLCDVLGEPGAEATPFPGDTPGWEDDLSHPRSADELAGAWESTWRIVEGCLNRWTPAMLGEQIRRDGAGRPPQVHTRQSILLRMITHEGYHLGEINVALGANGREPIDPWPSREWELRAPANLREG